MIGDIITKTLRCKYFPGATFDEGGQLVVASGARQHLRNASALNIFFNLVVKINRYLQKEKRKEKSAEKI